MLLAASAPIPNSAALGLTEFSQLDTLDPWYKSQFRTGLGTQVGEWQTVEADEVEVYRGTSLIRNKYYRGTSLIRNVQVGEWETVEADEVEVYCISDLHCDYTLNLAWTEVPSPPNPEPCILALHRNVLWYQGGLVFEAHRLVYHSG